MYWYTKLHCWFCAPYLALHWHLVNVSWYARYWREDITLVQVTWCLLTTEPFPSILDQVTASCERYQTRTVAGKVTCSGAVAHQGRAVREVYHQRTGHRWNGGRSGQLFISWSVNPRPAGVWIVTRPAGGGGGGPKGPPLRSPKLLDRFPNFKRHSIALYVNYPYKVKNLTRMSLMTSQVRSKSEFSTFRTWWHRRVKFRC